MFIIKFGFYYNKNTNLSWFLSRKLDGQPFGGYFRVRNPVLIIRDADLLRTMLVRDFNSFHDNLFPINEDLDPIFARNPFILTGERCVGIFPKLYLILVLEV